MDQEQQRRTFYDVIWPYRADVLRVALFLCHNRSTAEDLAQETLLKAWRRIDRLETGPKVKAWLLQILRNTWLDRVRAAADRPAEVSLSYVPREVELPPSRDAGHESAGDPRVVLESFSDQQIVHALQDLPEEIRWTLLLVDVEGQSVEDAARLLDVPPGTIKSRAHRGRLMLRDKLLPVAKELRWVPDDPKERSSLTEE